MAQKHSCELVICTNKQESAHQSRSVIENSEWCADQAVRGSLLAKKIPSPYIESLLDPYYDSFYCKNKNSEIQSSNLIRIS